MLHTIPKGRHQCRLKFSVQLHLCHPLLTEGYSFIPQYCENENAGYFTHIGIWYIWKITIFQEFTGYPTAGVQVKFQNYFFFQRNSQKKII